MNETLRVKIEGDISQLQKALNDAAKSIKGTEKELKDAIVVTRGYTKAQDQLTNEFKQGNISQKEYQKNLNRLQRDEKESQIEVANLRRQLSGLHRDYKSLGGSTNELTGHVGNLGKTTKANAVPALTSFSQVVQDAPYGIQGVANNIQQLTMQMGYLSSSAGGTGAALKAMLSSLAGPAGILMAVSLVTTAFVAYGDKLSGLIDSTNKLAKATKEYIGEAMAEVSNLKVLLEIANDHNASIVARRKAIEKINEKYSDYLGNLDEEKIKSGETKKAVDSLTRSLIQQAQVRGLEDVIGEETGEAAGKITELQLKIRDAAKQVKAELKAMDATGYWGKVIKDSNDVVGSLEAINKTGEKIPVGLSTAVSNYRELNEEIKEVENSAASAIKPYQELQKKLQEQIFSVSVVPEFDQEEITITGTKAEPVRVPVKAVLEMETTGGDAAIQGQMEFVKMLEQQIAHLTQAQAQFPVFSDAYKSLGEQIDFAKDRLSGFNNTLHKSATEATEAFAKRNEETKELNAQFLEDNLMVASMVSQAFGQMINTTVDGLLEGKIAFEDFAKGMIKSIANVLSQLAQQAIMEKIIGKMKIGTQQGVAMANVGVIASNTAAAAGPAGAVVLPGLLAGLGGLMSGYFGSLQAFESGGMVKGNSYSGDKILARLNSGEGVLTAQGVQNAGAMMNAPQMPLLSSPVFELGGGFVLEGDTIRMVLDRSDNRRGRIG